MRQSPPQHAGFTLIEITVALILMALLASTVALASRGMISGATQQDIVAQIESMDATARRHAKLTGQTVQLELDAETGAIRLTTPDQPEAPLLGSYMLPNGYRFEEPWFLRGDEAIDRDPLILQYDRHGTTRTWGLSLYDSAVTQTPTPSTTNTKQRLLLPGGGGGVVVLENDEAVQDILAQVFGRDTD